MQPHSPDLDRSIQALFNRRFFGIKPGLEGVAAVLAALGNPHHRLAVVHVAGTNGKGSVSAMLAAVFTAAGLRAGLYTSPHLVHFRERFLIDGRPIDDPALRSLIARVESAAGEAEKALGGRTVTFFECATALAFLYFAEAGVNIAVIETGLGGRLDATNVVLPLLSVITRIDMDHSAYLGNTLGAIAGEKGGIIKPGRPVAPGDMPEEARIRLEAIARERGSAIRFAPDEVRVQRTRQDLHGQRLRIESASEAYGVVDLPLTGRHQMENVALAVLAVEMLAELPGLESLRAALKLGLAATRWPGRLQLVRDESPILVDAAHNPGGAEALVKALKELWPRKPVAYVLGCMKDKDYTGMLRALSSRKGRVWAVQVEGERPLDRELLAQAARAAGFRAETATLPEALAAGEAWARGEGGLLCICGSIYLAGAAYEALGIAPFG